MIIVVTYIQISFVGINLAKREYIHIVTSLDEEVF